MALVIVETAHNISILGSPALSSQLQSMASEDEQKLCKRNQALSMLQTLRNQNWVFVSEVPRAHPFKQINWKSNDNEKRRKRQKEDLGSFRIVVPDYNQSYKGHQTSEYLAAMKLFQGRDNA